MSHKVALFDGPQPLTLRRVGADVPAIKEALLAALTATAAQRRAFDAAEQKAVEAAKAAGVSWEDIGECYSISRQAAEKRFKHLRTHRRRPLSADE